MEKTNKITKWVLLLTVILSVFLSTLQLSAHSAKAVVSEVLNFDSTAVEADLADIDLDKYSKDSNKELQFFEFVEYCYSDNVFNQSNYGLYLYIYNPKGIVFHFGATVHSVNMAVSYNEEGKPLDYANVRIEYVNRTVDDYAHLFYKFKVTDPTTIRQNATAYSKKYGTRRYDIAGIQLRAVGSTSAKDYGVGGTWKFSGFAKGYGSDASAASTLSCTKTDLEYVELDVKSTFYRPEGVVTKGHQDQLTSVYFAVPKRFKTDYGRLQKIKAAWDEQKTNLVAVMDNAGDANAFENYIGKDADVNSFPYSLAGNYKDQRAIVGALGLSADMIYNPTSKITNGFGIIRSTRNKLTAVYDKGSNAMNSVISGEDFLEDLVTYSNSIGGEKINDSYSTALFADSVDEGRIKGYYDDYEIDADDSYSLTSTVLDQNFWQRWLGIKNYKTTIYDDMNAIYEVKAADMLLSDSDMSNNLYMDINDVGDFRSYYTANALNHDIYLFRFATTDYYSVDLYSNRECVDGDNEFRPCGYLFEQTVFIDFDIITLTFSKDGVYTVIPVVANPIDIAGNGTPPVDKEEEPWWKQWLSIIMIVVLVVVLLATSGLWMPLVIWLLKLIWKIITFPFKLIASLFKKDKNGNKKNR